MNSKIQFILKKRFFFRVHSSSYLVNSKFIKENLKESKKEIKKKRKKEMNLQSYCFELYERIPGCINVTMYERNGMELVTSNTNRIYENEQYFAEEKVYDEVTKIGKGNHFATTLVLEKAIIIIVSCETIKLVIQMEPQANIGLVYSLIPSLQSTFTSQ